MGAETREETLQASSVLDELIDLEFEAYRAREGDVEITLYKVRKATAGIPRSMSQAIVEDERADRF